ncbi:cysteine-rich CWC family protein [Shewanella sp. SG44-2]|nr:cysteine-rich CWC family protein [Shewanella sp. SG44-2]
MTLFTSAAQSCPLCQQANGCAMEQGLAIDACWCAEQA